MVYSELKVKLLSMFDDNKLRAKPDEWGFYNESDKDIKTLGFATNLTPETITAASNANVDFLITHHDAWDFVFGMKDKCCELLDKFNITHAFFHAPLDDADFGTSSSLAKAIGLKNCKKAIPHEDIFFCAVIGKYETPIVFEQLSERLSDILNEPIRAYKNNTELIQRVCVTTGAGNMTNDIRAAAEEKCDTYITGEYGLYSQQYAKFANVNLLVGSHTNTEIPGVQSMVERLISSTDVNMLEIIEENY